MQILIVDSGVYREHPSFVDEKFNGYGLIFDKKIGECKRLQDFSDNLGHGTAVYNIIRKNCQEAEIKMIKVFDEKFEIDEDTFYNVLLYIYNNESPDIINLSLGLSFCNDIDRLYTICKKIQEKGTIIISAFDNEGTISYPAAFDCVYGVIGVPEITKANEIGYIKNSYANLCAKGTVSRLAWKNPDYILLAGNSFSCAMATSAIASKIMNQGLSITQLPIGTEEIVTTKSQFQIKKAALFPFNKEMHSLVRFPDLLNFEIQNIYDHRFTGRVGVSLKKYVDAESVPDKIIKDIDSIDWDGIDTLILGHIGELSALVKEPDLKDRIINKALEHDVQVYAFDPCELSKNVFYPKADFNDLPKNHFGKLFRINKPVLGVFGTSSRQGKFTLQLILRDLFQKKGYKVGQLGTEPSALLFEMDEVFPYGYNSTVSLSETEAILYVNRLMNNICMSDCEIIIAGAQSATFSYRINNINQFTPLQQSFLYATSPDCVILVVSPHDSFEYISRTINYIENTIYCKVIALCVFPKYIKSNAIGFNEKYESLSLDELNSFKINLKQHLNQNVYILGIQDEMNELVNNIIDFF